MHIIVYTHMYTWIYVYIYIYNTNIHILMNQYTNLVAIVAFITKTFRWGYFGGPGPTHPRPRLGPELRAQSSSTKPSLGRQLPQGQKPNSHQRAEASAHCGHRCFRTAQPRAASPLLAWLLLNGAPSPPRFPLGPLEALGQGEGEGGLGGVGPLG